MRSTTIVIKHVLCLWPVVLGRSSVVILFTKYSYNPHTKMRIRPHWEEGYMAVIGGACVALIHMRNNRPLVSGKKMAAQNPRFWHSFNSGDGNYLLYGLWVHVNLMKFSDVGETVISHLSSHFGSQGFRLDERNVHIGAVPYYRPCSDYFDYLMSVSCPVI